MADLKLTNEAGQIADLSLLLGDFATDSGLENAVMLSLFLDARADDDDILPDDETDRRGWWGDQFSEFADDSTGSKLWLLAREKRTLNILPLFESFAEEALQWMVDDGVAETVEVSAALGEIDRHAVTLSIAITRPDGSVARFSHDLNWERLENGVE
jgi:phage gp46-like protein